MTPSRAPHRVYRGPIIDVHMHPMLDRKPFLSQGPHGSEDYLKALGNLDVRFVGSLVMAPKSDLAQTRAVNDKVLRLSRRTGGRFYPVCSVHPADGRAALDEITRVARAGAKGLKLHPSSQGFDVAGRHVKAVVERATEHHLPILFDAYSPFDADQPGKFVHLALDSPDARLILAHAYGPKFMELLVYGILVRYPWWKRNVWIDLSAIACLLSGGPFAEGFNWVLRKVGVDRLLFGSDYPIDGPQAAVQAVTELGFSPNQLEKIFYTNAANLFNLTPLRRRTSNRNP